MNVDTAIVEMEAHSKICPKKFIGYEYFVGHHDDNSFYTTYFEEDLWESDVLCKACKELFAIDDCGHDHNCKTILRLNSYLKKKKYPLELKVEKEIKPEKIFCELLGICYETDQDLDSDLIEY